MVIEKQVDFMWIDPLTFFLCFSLLGAFLATTQNSEIHASILFYKDSFVATGKIVMQKSWHRMNIKHYLSCIIAWIVDCKYLYNMLLVVCLDDNVRKEQF